MTANLSGEHSLYPNLFQSPNLPAQRSQKPLGSKGYRGVRIGRGGEQVHKIGKIRASTNGFGWSASASPAGALVTLLAARLPGWFSPIVETASDGNVKLD